MKNQIVRIFAALLLLSMAVLSLPSVVHADGSGITINIVSVTPGVSVKIQANSFPGGLFTVRMAKGGGDGAGGTQVDVTNTGSGGTFQETYKIPAALKDEATIVIRLEKGSVFAFNTFTNKAGSQPTPTPVIATKPTATPVSSKASISILGVEKNTAVTLRAESFPANTTFTVRVGPFVNFFKNYVTTGTINSGKGGTFDFKVSLPGVVKDVEWVTVRLDGGGVYAYNAFKNVSGGTTNITSTPVSTPTTTYACTVVSVAPSVSVKPREDFDVVWQLKNTSSTNWEASSVDYKFVSGAALHKKTIYDLKTTVKPGETLKFTVDMLAPTSVGSYTESWAVVQGTKTLCAMNVTMTVK